MSTPDDVALFRAICDEPHDDAPRLVFADWLEEHNDIDRAEFIRVQCELARLDEEDPKAPFLHKRERELLAVNRKAWSSDAPRNAAATSTFQRGFLVPRIKLPIDVFLAQSLDDLAKFPLWNIAITGATGRAAQIARCSILRRTGELHLNANGFGRQGAEEFARCKYLDNVEFLDLGRNWMELPGLRALFEHLRVPQLRQLDLGGNYLDNSAVKPILKWIPADRLTHLDLRWNSIGDTGVKAIADCAKLRTLRTLILDENSIHDEGAMAIARSEHLHRLTELVLPRYVGSAGIEALANTPWAHRLRKLMVGSREEIGRRGVALATKLFGKRIKFHH